MPKMKYALEKDGPKRLELSWKGTWQELTVFLDGRQIGAFTDQEDLRAGQEFVLEDGTRLKVQLAGKSIFAMPLILFNNEPVAIAGHSHEQRLKMTYNCIFLLAGMNIFYGLHRIMTNKTIGSMPAGEWYSIALGVLFIFLALFIMRKSMLALSIAVGIYVLDSILIFFLPCGISWPLLLFIIIFRLGVLLVMAQGFSVIPVLNLQSKSEQNM